MFVKLVSGTFVCDAINAAFPEGVRVSDEPIAEINGSACFMLLPATAEEARQLAAIAFDDRAPVGLMLTLQTHKMFPIDCQWIAEDEND